MDSDGTLPRRAVPIRVVALSYDAKGNLTTDAGGTAYTWDFDNRLQRVDKMVKGDVLPPRFYKYDALGRRISNHWQLTPSSAERVYVSAGQQVLAEYVHAEGESTIHQSYVYGSYVDEPVALINADDELFYYHRNNLYSVAAISNTTGAVVERYYYDAYGVAGGFKGMESGL